MSDEFDNNNQDHSDPFLGLRKDADKGREPELFAAQLGSRWISMAALVERIEGAFIEEYGDNSPMVLEADTPTKRLKLILETANYIFAVESVQLSPQEKASVISRAYSSLFGYGPLDPLFVDDKITTIALEGADKASVRHQHGELVPVGPLFQTPDHFQRIIRRLLHDAGAELREDFPYMEVGLSVGERYVCVNLVAPPVTSQLTADIRVHPKALPAWEDLAAGGYATPEAAGLLQKLIRSPYGIMVIGEPESGKTTLLSLIAQELPLEGTVVAVERAGELRLPEGVQRKVVQWSMADAVPLTFGDQIAHALELQPSTLLLDEVRADEPLSIAPLLMMPDAPRQIWSFRGAVYSKRLQNALGMLARRADPSAGESLIHALYQRLPFVVTTNRVGGTLKLWSIGEWQFRHSPDYPTYVPLMQIEEGVLRPTGEQPARDIT
ncbi:MAG: Flp pilus assembly complex ATPase component TadA [Anaerolineae bacterium]|nr:Flp pilus assembly complex ATPase component TadA [Anaerolineae bacterium]